MPFPSRACKTCRSRHVKCDETYPVCNRCIKAGKECLGFARRPDHFAFRDENGYAGGIPRRPRDQNRVHSDDFSTELVVAAGSGISPAATARSTVSGGRSRTSTLRKPALIPRSPSISIETYAFADFAKRFIDSKNDISDTQWNHIRKYRKEWEFAEQPSVLGVATTALALAVFSQARTSSVAAGLSMQKYNDAVKKTQAILLHGDRLLEDQTIITVMMLDVYEGTMADLDQISQHTPRCCHLTGAETILKIRKEKIPFEIRMTSILDRDIRRRLMRAAVFRGNSLPEWLRDGAQFGECGVSLQLDTAIVQITQLRHDSRRFLRNLTTIPVKHTQPNLAPAETIINQALAVEHDLIAWTENLPTSWSFTVYNSNPNANPQEHTNNPTTSITYPSLEVARAWDLQRAARLVTNGTITALTQHSPFLLHQSQFNTANQNIKSLIRDIRSSVPYYYGQRSPSQPPAYETTAREVTLLTFPLCIAAAIRRISEEERKWFKREILRVSLFTGSGTLKNVGKSEFGADLRGLV